MHKVLLLVVIAATAAFVAVSSSPASADPGTGGAASAVPTTRAVAPRVACATCGGGGNVQGCATVYVNNPDGYGNWVKAYYHWCWLNGAISSNYGWGDEAACWGFCNFQGWNYNLDFSYGHRDKGTFRDVQAPLGIPIHVDSSDAACVSVDGWGNSWGC